PLVRPLLATAKELVESLPFVLQVSYLLLDGHSDPRQLLHAETGALRKLANVLVELRHSPLLGELLKHQKEDNVVREYNDLPGFGFQHKPSRHPLAPLVVE